MKIFFYISVIISFFNFQSDASASQREFYSGQPHYESDDTKRAVEEMIIAHGGMDRWANISTLQFGFFTKVIGAPNPQPPFYSVETTNLNTGAAIIEWPWFSAETIWDGEHVWSRNWPIKPLPPGFFTQLTTSFITLPWLTQTKSVNLYGPFEGRLPADAHDPKTYDVVRMTFEKPNPKIPGEYYEIYIDPETKLMRAIKFNITHPGMVRIAGQNIGPNYHVISEYQNIDGFVMPTYYFTYGSGNNAGQNTNALHVVFNLKSNVQIDDSLFAMPADAVLDEETTDWWNGDLSQ